MFISGYARYYPRVSFPFVPFRPFECSVLDEYEVQRAAVARRDRANERFRNWEERLERIEKLLTPPAEEEEEDNSADESEDSK